jgi:hypothetical protein
LALFVGLSIGLFWFADTQTAVFAVVVNGVAAGVGAVILLRADQKVIGGLLLILALSWQLGPLVEGLIDAGYSSAWLKPLFAVSWMTLGAALILILIFPQGTFPTRSWRIVSWVFVAADLHEYTTSDALLHDLEGVVVETMSPRLIGTWERG